MKFARISMAVLMLLAIIFKSLPDSVFNYFHSHSHASASDPFSSTHHSIIDYQHNCHIEDWNYESFEVIDNNFQPAAESTILQLTVDQPSLIVCISISAISRGPPAV